MATQVPNVNNMKSGLCPHGLPPGACPICSNMGGGGMRAGERRQKPGEMSYHECVMMGNLIRSRKLANKQEALIKEQRAESFKNFEATMSKISLKIQQFINNTQKNNFILKPIIFLSKNVVLPSLKLIQNIPNFINNIKNFKVDIQDKLNAIFGETKNFIEKKLSDIVNTIKNKLDSLFKIFKRNRTQDDDNKIEEDKKIFNLKKILHKIIRKKKEDDEYGSQNKQ